MKSSYVFPGVLILSIEASHVLIAWMHTSFCAAPDALQPLRQAAEIQLAGAETLKSSVVSNPSPISLLGAVYLTPKSVNKRYTGIDTLHM